MNNSSKNLVILGATGSIGDSVVDIILRHPDRFNVIAITGHSNICKLIEISRKIKPTYVLISDKKLYKDLKTGIDDAELNCQVLAGKQALNDICKSAEVDMVVAGIVGAAGMEPVLSAVTSGKELLLANKEALVMAGDLVMTAAKQNNAKIVPLDSEHNAIYQCLPESYQIGHRPNDIEKIILTASGGPFWMRSIETFDSITPAQACAHPNWDMGKKISVDSATLMNKGLEIIEAHWLFDLEVDKIDVHVHPQSIIHSMVCYKDGSVLAQLGEPDMRIPIAYSLGLRKRIASGAQLVDLLKAQTLQFYPPDYKKFPSLALAQEAIKTGGTAMSILNVANEISVDAFLNNKISFNAIAQINHYTMHKIPSVTLESIDQLNELTLEVENVTQSYINSKAF